MAPAVVLPREFDIKKVDFSALKTLDNGGKIVYVGYGPGKGPLFMQTPPMSAPFGMSVWDNDGKAVPKHTLDLSFKGMDSCKKLQKFYDVLEALDQRLVDDGFANQSSWFKGKKYGSRDIVEALYTPLIKYAKDRETGERTDKYPPTMKLSVPFRDGVFTCQAFDDNKKPVDLSQLETLKGATVSAIIQCTGIWFAGGKFGVSWRVVQMRVVPNDTSFNGFAFRGDGDDVVELGDASAAHGARRGAESSSDSEEDEDEVDDDVCGAPFFD